MNSTSVYENIINPRLREQLNQTRRETEEEMVALYIEHAKHVQMFDFQCDDGCVPTMRNVHEWLCSKSIVQWPVVPAVQVCQHHERLFFDRQDVAACQLASIYYEAFLKPPPTAALEKPAARDIYDDSFFKSHSLPPGTSENATDPLAQEEKVEESCTAECLLISVPMTLYLAKKWNPPWLPIFACTTHNILHVCHGNNVVCRNRKSSENTRCIECLKSRFCASCSDQPAISSCSFCNEFRSCAECHQRGNVRCMTCMETHLCMECRRAIETNDDRCIGCLQNRLCIERCPMNLNSVDHNAANICFFSKRVVSYLSSNEDAKHRRVAQANDFVPLRNNRTEKKPAKYAETASMMLQRWLEDAIRHGRQQKQAPPVIVNRQTAITRITTFLIDTAIVDEETGMLTIVPRDIWQYMPLLYANQKETVRLPPVPSDTMALFEVANALYTAYNELCIRRVPLAEVMKRIAEDGMLFHTISHEYDKDGKITATYTMDVGVMPLLQNYALRLREHCPESVVTWLEKKKAPPPELNAPAEAPYCAAVRSIKMYPTFYCVKEERCSR